MKLSNFSVTNFRSITTAHKIPIAETTILIGKNNEGKSNLLKALDVAMNILKDHARDSRKIYPTRTRLSKYGADENTYEWLRDFPIPLQEGKDTHSIFKLQFILDDQEVNEFVDEIGSSLDGNLPIQIRIGKDNQAVITVAKKGRGAKVLTSKSLQIASFVAKKITFNYIPAVRTTEEAMRVVNRMLSQQLRAIEDKEEYIKAFNALKALQKPLLEELENKIKESLADFLPNINNVKIELEDMRIRNALRSDFEIIINDGTPTRLEYKGDGVKSLATLALLKRRYVERGASIIAIEEPESHLHPHAIHQLNEVISSLAEKNQIIVTTHNPLFVDRQIIKSNIIIDNGTVRQAKNIAEIRDLLGVKASDNLTNANYVLVVEGEEDVIALNAILPKLNSKIEKALKSNMLIIEPMGGAGSLSYKLSLLKNSLCICHVLLDNDAAGRNAYEKAIESKILTIKRTTFINCQGMPDSEFEDCIDSKIYKVRLDEEFGVNIASPKFRGNSKWSDRVKDVFQSQGKLWNESIKQAVKRTVAECIVKNPNEALNTSKRSSIDALVSGLDEMIKT